MYVSQSFRQSIEALDALIVMCGLHKSDGPVELQDAIDFLNIAIRYSAVPVKGEHGYAFADPGSRMDNLSMVINSLDPLERQRQTKGHELYHLLRHDFGKPHHSFDGQARTVEEDEADMAAAYLLVPLGCLVEGIFQSHTVRQIAWELGVPGELVELRLKLAFALDEIK